MKLEHKMAVYRTKNVSLQAAVERIEAQARLEREGLELPRKPKGEVPQLPHELAELSDDLLMRLFSRLTRWADYLAVQVTLAEIDEGSAESILGHAKAVVLVRDWGGTKEDRVTVARAEQTLDPDVRNALSVYQQAHAYRKMIGVLYSNVERDAGTVSRELTRRVGREPLERRDRRWNS